MNEMKWKEKIYEWKSYTSCVQQWKLHDCIRDKKVYFFAVVAISPSLKRSVYINNIF